MIPLNSITIRSLLPADEAFVCRVYAVTRQEEMKLVDGSPEQKKVFLRMQFDARTAITAHYPGAECRIIQRDGGVIFHRKFELFSLEIS